MQLRSLVAALTLFMFAPSSWAQSETAGIGGSAFSGAMAADRPDFTEGVGTIDPGHMQIESGYTYTHDRKGGTQVDTHDLPELLLRGGVTTSSELRLDWTGGIFTNTHSRDEDDHSEEGVSDMGIGFKQRLFESEGAPTLGYLFALGLPVGSEEFTSKKVEPELKLLWDYELSEKSAVGGNFNFAAPNGDDGRFFEFSFSVSAGYAVSDELGAYLEYFALFPDGGLGETDTHYLNTGLAYSLNENMQVDVRFGVGLNDDADDFFTGAGFSVRI